MRVARVDGRHIANGAGFSVSLGLLVLNLEVLELVGVLLGGNDTQELLKVLLLEILLHQVLKIALGEGDLGLDDDAGLLGGESNGSAEGTLLAVNLDVLAHPLEEIVENDNIILDWDSAVDDELLS